MPSTPTLSPQVLGQAESAHRAVLDRILASTGITYHQWVALSITAASGDTVERRTLVGRMTGALHLDNERAVATIAELTASGLLEALPGEGSRVGLTREGGMAYRERRTAVDEVTTSIYGDIPADDLETAGRVLTTITARLDAEVPTVASYGP